LRMSLTLLLADQKLLTTNRIVGREGWTVVYAG